jgi:two-component system, NarL family, sensor kinase
LRKSAYNLMPEVLLTQGLAVAVQTFCERMTARGSTRINFQSIGKAPETGQAVDLQVYRIIQELVHNIIKHAQARQAVVQMNFEEEGHISITIEDDGVGFETNDEKQQKGMGLANVKERIRDLGGKIDIQSSVNTGTSIYIEIESLHEQNG